MTGMNLNPLELIDFCRLSIFDSSLIFNDESYLKYLEMILKCSIYEALIEKFGALNPVTFADEHFSSSLIANEIFFSKSSKFSFLTES